MHYLDVYQNTEEARTYLKLLYKSSLAEFDSRNDPDNDDLFNIFVDAEMEVSYWAMDHEDKIWRKTHVSH